MSKLIKVDALIEELCNMGFPRSVVETWAESLPSSKPAAQFVPEVQAAAIESLAIEYNTMCEELAITEEHARVCERELELAVAFRDSSQLQISEFEKLHGAHLAEIKQTATNASYIPGFDPYPMLDPQDVCRCGSRKMYRSCCGRRAFCNPANGKIRKCKKGDIRYLDYLRLVER